VLVECIFLAITPELLGAEKDVQSMLLSLPLDFILGPLSILHQGSLFQHGRVSSPLYRQAN
jgi:hypothetical protein